MSLGNLKDNGNKGNNFPFQVADIRLNSTRNQILLGILGALGGVVAPTTAGGPIRATAAGTIPAGSFSFSAFNAGGANGTINGGIIKPGEEMNWQAKQGSTFPGAIAYDGTGTELVITYTI